MKTAEQLIADVTRLRAMLEEMKANVEANNDLNEYYKDGYLSGNRCALSFIDTIFDLTKK